MRTQVRPLGLAIALAGVLAVVGCGGDATVTLTGTVTVGGQPLALGNVAARGPNGDVHYGAVQDGKYTVYGVPRGVVKLAVSEPITTGGGEAGGSAAGRQAAAPGRKGGVATTSKSRIPSEYQDPDKTPITHDTATSTTKDIVIP